MRISDLSTQQKISLILGILLLLPGIYLGYIQYSQKGNFTLSNHNSEELWSSLPYQSTTDNTAEFDILTKINMPGPYFSSLIINVDDCLLALSVNGIRVETDKIPYCDWQRPITLEGISSFKTGLNIIEVKIRNINGPVSFDIRFAPSSWLRILRWTLIISATFLLSYWLFGVICQNFTWLQIVLAFSVCLRVLYFLATPAEVRSHDMKDHAEYIRHALATFELPDARDGWQFYQPPLYYWLASLFFRALQILPLSVVNLEEVGMLLGLLLSIYILIISYFILYISIPDSKRNISLLTGSALLGTFPGLIINTVKLNNDSLIIAIGSTVIFYSIRWWQKGQFLYWLAANSAICAGIFTKLNILILAPAVLILPLIKKDFEFRKRIIYLIISLGLISFTSLIYSQLRQDANKSFSDNKISIFKQNPKNSGRIIDNQLRIKKSSLINFLTFNPAAVINIPFVDTRNDTTRRWAFPEYFFKTAFFGEFKYSDNLTAHARILMIFALLTLAVLVLETLKINHSIPFIFFVVSSLAGVVYFRYKYAMAPVQDFRYFAPAASVIFALLANAISRVEKVFLRCIYSLVFCILVILQSTFLIRVCTEF